MPGIAGLVNPDVTPKALASQFEALTGWLHSDPAWQLRCWQGETEGVALATVGRDSEAAGRALASRGQSTLVMEGELFGEGRDSPAEYLLAGFARDGAGFLSAVQGRFVAAVWSAADHKLTLLTDKFASKPLYYSTDQRRPAFATSIRALTALLESPSGLNLDGVVQFFTYGHLWNNDTFFDSVRCLGPATELAIPIDGGPPVESCYWRPRAREPIATERASVNRVVDALKQSVEDQTHEADGLGVALSGGLDARTMLALVDTDRVRPKCVSLGMQGSLDQLSAERLAELAGCEYHRFVLGEGFLEGFESHLSRMVELTDGHYLSQCIVMPTFPLYRELGVRALLRGHVGELLHMHKAYNFSVDREFSTVANEEALKNWLWTRLQSHLTDGVDEPLLRGLSPGEFRDSGQRTLQAALDETDHFDGPLDRLSQLFLDQRTRRETAMSLVKFNSIVDVRVPYLDSRVIDAVFALPPGLRIGEHVQTEALRRCRPSFLRPANSNTGAPVGAGEAWKKFCTLRMKVLAKLGVKGYQPYERLGLWLRQELRPLVERVLLTPDCLDRGLLNPDCVRAVVRRHSAGERNHTYLIMAMMIVELGLRSANHQERFDPSLTLNAG